MIIKTIVDEDFVNYKKPSMFIAFPKCDWKCEKECGMRVCQNSTLATSPDIDIDVNKIVDRYLSNPLTQAIVIGGLEPFDSFFDLYDFIRCLRVKCGDEVIIYTGYTKDELKNKKIDVNTKMNNGATFNIHSNFYDVIESFRNIIIKFGRYIPNQKPHYDEMLGVYLASDNQYAEKVS